MNEITVLAIGSEILFGEHKTKKASVNAIRIERGRVLYEVVYWDDDDKITRELEEHELAHDGTRQTMRVNLRLS